MELIDCQITKQRKLGAKLRELKQAVDRNNEDLEAVNDRVKNEIAQGLTELIGPRVQLFLCCTVILIFGAIVAALVLFIFQSADDF